MAPTEDLLHHAEAAEQLAAWIGGRDRDRLLEIACDLRRRAEGRRRLWFWIPPAAAAPRAVRDLNVDEDWSDAAAVRFSVVTATGGVSFEAPRAVLPRLVSQLARLSRGEPPNHLVLQPAQWKFLRDRRGGMALQVELAEGGVICLPLARMQAAKLLSWLELALGGLRLRRLRLVARTPASPAAGAFKAPAFPSHPG